jgi:hypothetical protein
MHCEPPDADPHVRWCGRGWGKPGPYPIARERMISSRRSGLRCIQMYSEARPSVVIAAVTGRCRQQDVGGVVGASSGCLPSQEVIRSSGRSTSHAGTGRALRRGSCAPLVSATHRDLSDGIRSRNPRRDRPVRGSQRSRRWTRNCSIAALGGGGLPRLDDAKHRVGGGAIRSGRPSSASINGRLHMAWKGAGMDQGIWWASSR